MYDSFARRRLWEYHSGRVLYFYSSRLRKVILFLVSKIVSQRCAFTFVAFAVIISKIVHIVAQERGLPRRHLALWSFSFVAQDLILLTTFRIAIEWSDHLPQKDALLRVAVKGCNLTAMAFAGVVSVVNIAFFAYTRSEVRWRNVALARDPSARGLLLCGTATLLAVILLLTAIAATLQNYIFSFARVAIDVLKWPWERFSHYKNGGAEFGEQYSKLPAECGDITECRSVDSSSENSSHRFLHILWSTAIVGEILSFIFRPSTGSLTYMSWTAPLVPFVDFKESASNLQQLQPVYGSGINWSWDNKTALDRPPSFAWLPRDTVLPGFEDWYEADGKHYNAAADPLKISNLDQHILPELRHNLSDVSINHIVLVVLESTRKDVFPIKKNGLIWNRFAKAHGARGLPDVATERLKSLTPTANHLTGDFDDGFFRNAKPSARGGINFKDAYTTATYTLKSMVGTMCGIWPLIADLNMEYLHHIYQPCLPQILEAFTFLEQQNATKDADSSKWRSHFFQSVTLAYDNGDIGTKQFGFRPENIVDSRYLRSNDAKFGMVDLPDINYFGFEESPLLDYFRDAFISAKTNDERVFITHLTSTTHHPYSLPANEAYVSLGNGRLQQLSHYVNSVGYDDRWLGNILDLLDEEGVADETLVIVTGDHGISLPENDKPASYYNPNTGCNHVPLVLSHPKLPAIDVAGSVSTMEILPTVLDLLRETGSLSEASRSAAGDLLANYEGQSLIRTLCNSAPKTAKGTSTESGQEFPGIEQDVLSNWQFIIMNPGRAMIGIRDKRKPHWRLVAPVIKNVVWRFNDLQVDPNDIHPVEEFDFATFLADIEKWYSIAEAKWAEEAAFIARWFIDENNKRWQYGQYKVQS